MKLILDLRKTVDENASIYYEKAKKAKKKMEGAKIALENTKKKLKSLDKNIEKHKEKIKTIKKKRKPEWFEKFRWFYSSNGFLIIGGRDSTTNEILIKKHTQEGDLVFHTDISGSPFGIVKAEKKQIDEDTKKEAAQFVASYSKAWKLGISTVSAWYVTPDQVTKQAPSGEFIQKGSFMIYGKKTIIDVMLELYLGLNDKGIIMSGPKKAVESHCKQAIKIVQGKEKATAVAKMIQKKIGGELDDIIKVLPSGGCAISTR